MNGFFFAMKVVTFLLSWSHLVFLFICFGSCHILY
uniref:Uncharacterized protein n=1 Tax=Rhizophora mucronata TaxID=61149 RepID=A0A2P2NQP1_RHIMU